MNERDKPADQQDPVRPVSEADAGVNGSDCGAGEMDIGIEDEATERDSCPEEAAAPQARPRERAAGEAPAREGSPEPQAAGEESERAALEIQALRDERDLVYDRWLRAQADLDNYRKRVEREREEFRTHALESFFHELVQVLDNFDRALAALSPEAPRSFVEGVRLIHKQLLNMLAKRGLVAMERAAGPFDPHRHEAVATEVRDDVPRYDVLDEVQKGYMFGGRVLRPALVKVSVRSEEKADAEEAS